ncbi:phospholipase D3-like isoform X2 [Python bivittatus]|uniref:Phospholipase D3-like isoform X2 n=1 Tax=Python bivittatus TaxID=176946 RepID=A0A9F5JB28_PYTBI|nr:phospholipase D3-like isoform X2 [Python bivittatus]
MRKKLAAPSQVTDTPMRRSTRLQQEKTAEKSEPQRSRGSRTADILQPRESIKAYKKQVDPTKDPPDLPEVPSEPEAQLDVRQHVEKEKVLLEKPNVQWEVVKDQRARLQVLDTSKPPSGKAGHLEDPTTPSLERPVETRREPRQKSWTGITPRIKVPPMKKTEVSKLPSKVIPAQGIRKKWPKPNLYSLFFLLLFLILSISCWFVWKHGIPNSFILGYGPLTLWKSFATLWSEAEECDAQCSLVLLESIPDTLQFQPPSPQNPTIYQAWMDLLSGANSTVEIAAFYFTLRDSDLHMEEPSAKQGLDVFNLLRSLPSRGVKLEIAVNSPQSSEDDTDELVRHGADVRYVNMTQLTGGIVHTKLWVVDRKHIYIGSANMDWRSLTKVKELGVVLYNCSCLAKDLHRIFAMYQALGKEGASIPTTWPRKFAAESSLEEPRKLQLNGVEARVYISSSPPVLCSAGRTSDLTAILSTIEDAEKFIYISVMDYEPQCLFCKTERFWPVIDNALRTAACDKRVTVRLLIGCWQHSRQNMFVFLESLMVLRRKPLHCPIDVKLFVVPTEGEQIPYTYVNHNKYMVTDRVAYIGTSNWSEDYFLHTTGVGLIVNQSDVAPEAQSYTLRQQLVEVFLRDWESSYILPLENHWKCMEM